MTRELAQSRWWTSAEQDPIHQAAAEWLTRLEDPQLSHEEALAWQQWMSADARHADAFRRLDEVREQLAALRPSASAVPDSVESLRKDRYDGSVPVGEWLSEPERHRRFSFRPAALAASIVLVVAVSMVWTLRESATVIRSEIGENRSVLLKDGSRVILGGDTELAVTFGDSERLVRLVRGEAFFDIAKDASRPFSVRAGGTTVTAVGTQFNVRRGSERVVVAVVEGRVMVDLSPVMLSPDTWVRQLRSREAPVEIDAGYQTTVAKTGMGSAVSLPQPEAVAAWRTGRLAFEREPLRYVLEDVNRYSAKPIVVGDPEIGNLMVTGTVLDGNVEGWVQSLEDAFELRAVEEDGKVVLTREFPVDP